MCTFDIFYSLHMQRIGQLMHTLSNVFFSLTLVKLSIHVFLVETFKQLRRVLVKPRLILDEMCRLYGKFASYLRRVLCKTRLIFPRSPIVVCVSSFRIITVHN